MLTGPNGLINKATQAGSESITGEEKERVAMAYNGALTEKYKTDINATVTAGDMQREFDRNETNVREVKQEGNRIKVVFDKTGNVYYVEADGTITVAGNEGTAVSVTPERPSEEPSDTFTGESDTTEYGVIEVTFLQGNGYTATSTANEPTLGAGMKVVYWDDEGTEVTSTDAEYDASKWYNYIAQSGSTASGGTSEWANAITEDGSYWVWIPRFAYRIIYFDTTEHASAWRAGTLGMSEEEAVSEEIIIGYSDARGIVDPQGRHMANQSNTSDTGISVNSQKMRTHPAFLGIGSESKGGGFGTDANGITGFWVAKYEMSQESSTTNSNNNSDWLAVTTNEYSTGNILTTKAGNTSTTEYYRAVSKPGVTSWRYIYVGNMYENSFNYSRTNESHMMKNSEWGAVAYLADSKYGRNGTEVTINNSDDFYTGNAGNSISASLASGITNAYNTSAGMLASTTGNITGIYDLSGGAWEYVAVYNTSGKSDYLTDYGLTLVSSNSTNTKYVTQYTNESEEYANNFTLGNVSVIGDAIREIYVSDSVGWNSDYVDFVSAEYPFLGRGGAYDYEEEAGLFCSCSLQRQRQRHRRRQFTRSVSALGPL